MPPAAHSPAQLGRYEITGTLGRGAMGVVYKARDPLIERTVAIKTVACSGLSREETQAFEQRFYREAKSAGRLNHPNIVTVYDVGRCGDLAYIAMELLVGQSLRELLDSGVILTPERIAGIVAQIADGLAFAHANEVVHRDIKPANVIIIGNDVVKIADFGVALLPSGSMTLAGTALGSPKYMAPEQITGQKIDGRADIFSLGALLHELLTGHPPFMGDDLGAILYQVLNSKPPAPSSCNPRLPPDFDPIVARALAKNPDERYQNAAQMADDLRKLAQPGKPTHRNDMGQAVRRHIPVGTIGDATVQFDKNAASTQPRVARNRKIWWLSLPLLTVFFFAGWLLSRPATPPVGNDSPSATIARPAASQETAPILAESVAPHPGTAPPAVQEVASLPAAEKILPPPNEGQLRLAIAPWGEVHVDGKLVGVSPPLNELHLPSGKHSIEIRNEGFAPYRRTVELAPGASLRIKHKFQ